MSKYIYSNRWEKKIIWTLYGLTEWLKWIQNEKGFLHIKEVIEYIDTQLLNPVREPLSSYKLKKIKKEVNILTQIKRQYPGIIKSKPSVKHPITKKELLESILRNKL